MIQGFRIGVHAGKTSSISFHLKISTLKIPMGGSPRVGPPPHPPHPRHQCQPRWCDYPVFITSGVQWPGGHSSKTRGTWEQPRRGEIRQYTLPPGAQAWVGASPAESSFLNVTAFLHSSLKTPFLFCLKK